MPTIERRDDRPARLIAAGRDMSSIELIAAVAKAAELGTIGEQMRADMLRGRPVSPDDLVRIERLSAATLRALHLRLL